MLWLQEEFFATLNEDDSGSDDAEPEVQNKEKELYRFVQYVILCLKGISGRYQVPHV